MVELQAGELRCQLEPGLGGCISGLWFGSEPVLRSTAPSQLTTARQSGSYPLVPFSNRLAHARLDWQGTLYALVRNNGDEPHAIHGVGWQRPWTVLDSSADFALLSYEHRADASWPFAFDSSQSFRIAPDSLELTLSVTNQSQQPAPAGLGWHPFFTKRAGGRIAFEAKGRWEMGPDQLPTHRTASRGVDQTLDALAVDHCFDGWTGAIRLRDPVLDIHISSSLSRLVVFTNPAREHVAVEPVSHVNNAASLVAHGEDPAALGLVVLAPGQSLSAQMTIEVRRST